MASPNADVINLEKSTACAVDVNPYPNRNGYGDAVLNNLAIRTSLKNIILGYIGCKSRLFNSSFGSQTYFFLQEPMDDLTAFKIKNSLQQAISRWEPRVRVGGSDITVIADPTLPGYTIRIYYTIMANSKTDDATFTLKI